MKSFSHLNSAVAVLTSYNGSEPFHLYLKKYFSANKKYGSKDRKQIASLCYNYFRLGHAPKNISTEERIVLATLLCENKPSVFLESIKPQWNELIQKSLQEKLAAVNWQQAINAIFPFQDELSEGIDAEKLSLSFFVQPKLFLRIRPGNEKRVLQKLSAAAFEYEIISKNCVALPNSSKIDAIIQLDKEAVVQDYNSQKAGEFIKLQTINYQQQTFHVWDCCAASGGKSIMAYDLLRNIELTVSDKRKSILQNLHKRFARAGIKKYHSFVADITNYQFKIQNSKFDLIICDAPCTGSGTWARTPEQLLYFKKELISKYSSLQKKILEKVIPHIKPGGNLLYITCSVFAEENEKIAKWVESEFKMQLQKSEVLKGYEIKADTMFAALFTAPLI